MSDSYSGIASLVPQIFFDIIARLVPGSVMIGVILIAAMGPQGFWNHMDLVLNKPSDSYPSIFLIGALGLALSYVLAIILFGFWGLLSKPFERLPIIKKLAESRESDHAARYDFIRHNDASAGSRIAKIKAEEHMTSVLSVGFILSFFINLIRVSGLSDWPRLILGLALFIFIIGTFGAMYHFYIVGGKAVKNHSDMLGFKSTKKDVMVETTEQNGIPANISEAHIDDATNVAPISR
jgi:hypothetical protein